MDESAYLHRADRTLTALADRLDAECGDLDVELHGGVLTLTLPNRSQYVLNRHLPSRRVWASSPVSGAHYFDLDGEEWREKGIQLEEWLMDELHALGVADA